MVKNILVVCLVVPFLYACNSHYTKIESRAILENMRENPKIFIISEKRSAAGKLVANTIGWLSGPTHANFYCYIDEKIVNKETVSPGLGGIVAGEFVVGPVSPGKHMLSCKKYYTWEDALYRYSAWYRKEGEITVKKNDIYVFVDDGNPWKEGPSMKIVDQLPANFYEDYQLNKNCKACTQLN